MNYKLEIERQVKQTIVSWHLPREILVRVYAHLHDELVADPDAHLGEVIVPTTSRVYYLAVGGQEFAFMVERDDPNRLLRIKGCRRDKGGELDN